MLPLQSAPFVNGIAQNWRNPIIILIYGCVHSNPVCQGEKKIRKKYWGNKSSYFYEKIFEGFENRTHWTIWLWDHLLKEIHVKSPLHGQKTCYPSALLNFIQFVSFINSIFFFHFIILPSSYLSDISFLSVTMSLFVIWDTVDQRKEAYCNVKMFVFMTSIALIGETN